MLGSKKEFLIKWITGSLAGEIVWSVPPCIDHRWFMFFLKKIIKIRERDRKRERERDRSRKRATLEGPFQKSPTSPENPPKGRTHQRGPPQTELELGL